MTKERSVSSKSNARTRSGDEAVKRVRLSPEDRRQQLITLGARMLRERALEDVSIGEIAKQAGISRGLLFHYFPTKGDFHLAIIQHANSQLLERTAPDPTLGTYDMLRDSLERYVDYVTENRTSYLALLRGPASASPELVAMVDAHRRAQVDRILTAAPSPRTPRTSPASPWPSAAGSPSSRKPPSPGYARNPSPEPTWSTCSSAPWRAWRSHSIRLWPRHSGPDFRVEQPSSGDRD